MKISKLWRVLEDKMHMSGSITNVYVYIYVFMYIIYIDVYQSLGN